MASISKRGDFWRVQIRVRGHDSINRTFDKKADAEKWARQVGSELDRGIYYVRTEAEQTTRLEALDRYEREIISKKKYPGQELQRVKHWRS